MRRFREFSLAGVAAVALFGASCSTDAIAPTPRPDPVPSVAVYSGDGQVGVVGAPLPDAIAVVVSDHEGAPLSGEFVIFEVTSGGGSVLSSRIVTNASGVASTVWRLGSGVTAAPQTLIARIEGLPGESTTFSATAMAVLEKAGGDGQTGEVDRELAQRPRVIARDPSGAAVAGARVRWSVRAGGGAVDSAETFTDTQGVAEVAWTLGRTVGDSAHVLEASIGQALTVRFTASGVLTTGIVMASSRVDQSGFTGWMATETPVVVVMTNGPVAQPVSGAVVRWTVTAGGGTLSAGTSRTDAQGQASVDWTLGGAVGANSQSLSASVERLAGPPVAFVASVRPAPASIAVVSGDHQAGPAGRALAAPLVVVVRDASGAPVPGAGVTWVPHDDFGYGNPMTTDAGGLASYTAVMGIHAGGGVLLATAKVDGLLGVSVTFSGTAVAGPPADIWPVSGYDQTGIVGTQLPVPLEVKVQDAFGNAIQGATVLWAASPGSGSTAASSSVTDTGGHATMRWTIGTTIGSGNQSATAAVAGLPYLAFTFNASATAGP